MIVAAAAVVIVIANPFADALLVTGTSFGLDPYFLIQSVVPLATETPEFVIVAVLVANRRPAQGLALFLASSVSQWTLGLGALPIAYLAGGGGSSGPRRRTMTPQSSPEWWRSDSCTRPRLCVSHLPSSCWSSRSTSSSIGDGPSHPSIKPCSDEDLLAKA